MNTLGIRSCTGAGGGDTYLTGCLGIDVDLDVQNVNIGVTDKLIDIGTPIHDVDMGTPTLDVDMSSTDDIDVNVIIQDVDIDNGCQ